MPRIFIIRSRKCPMSARIALSAIGACACLDLTSVMPGVLVPNAFAQGENVAVVGAPLALFRKVPDSSSTLTVPVIREGDRLRLAFYEKFDDDEEKWRGHTRSPDAGFHQFSELCGDYVVQDDGSVSLPLLGRFTAAGSNRDKLLAELSKSFDELVGRKGFVNIISVEHQPVYVVGPVKNPGAFKFVQGMTVFHAIALAGGIRVTEAETWQRVESRREIDRLQRSLDKVKRLLVRTDVLKTEGGSPLPKNAVASLVGSRDVALLKDEEDGQRKLTAQSRAATEASLVAAVQNARSDLAARTERLKPLDRLIAVREERERTVSQLVDHSTVARPVLVQTQSELADVQDRKQSALIDADLARSHLAEAERELAKHRLESSVELGRAISVAERDTNDSVSDAEGTLELVKSLSPKARQAAPTYEVARRTATGTVVLTLPGTAPLDPGDLVRLKQDETNER